MIKRYIVLTCLVVSACLAHSQNTEQDSLPPLPESDLAMDTSINYDELLSDFEFFLDSILSPRSYFLANLSATRGYFSFVNTTDARARTVKKYIVSPALGYYSKNGLGITITGNATNYHNRRLKLYQLSVSPSFDYLANRKLATGISFMRYITRDSLPFYTSPLQNEIYGYFLWRKSWLQPGITANYGWGSRTEYKKREFIYRKLLANALEDGIITVIDTVSILTANRESIVDFTLTGSLRHDFYWLNIFSHKDHARFTPLLSFTAGTQKFGYNQTTGTYSGIKRANLVNYTGTRSLSLIEKFRALSLSLYLRSEYSIGKFFIQPQVIFDYYFPAKDDNLSTLFTLNAGFMF
jgi:hypothetical protein